MSAPTRTWGKEEEEEKKKPPFLEPLHLRHDTFNVLNAAVDVVGAAAAGRGIDSRDVEWTTAQSTTACSCQR